MDDDEGASTRRGVGPGRPSGGTTPANGSGPKVHPVLTTSEMRRRRDRAAVGALVAFLGLLLVAVPAYIAFIFGVDANRETCVDVFGEPCRTAPQFFGVVVALFAAPLLLGIAIARPRQTRAWVVATVGAALALFVVLLVAT